MMKKLLILNCTKAISGIERLNRLFISIFEPLNIDFDIVHLTENLPNLQNYTHLIISGSALLVTEENELDWKIFKLIDGFIGKNILGICYGHQILANKLMSKNVCRKSLTPELGWKQIDLKPNPLFDNLDAFISYESHLEEVIELNDDFNIIAANNDCQIQAYQYKDKSIWGVQFHPEYTYDYGLQSLKNKLKYYPEREQFLKNELDNPAKIKQNHQIFANFLNT